jgi:hypothetical protein
MAFNPLEQSKKAVNGLNPGNQTPLGPRSATSR